MIPFQFDRPVFIKQEFNGGSAGTGGTCTLARNGDLVQEIYVQGTSAANPLVTPIDYLLSLSFCCCAYHYLVVEVFPSECRN